MSRVSQTARMIAAYRARHSASEDPLFTDPWAAALAGPEGESLAARWDAIYPHMTLWVALRTAFLDRVVRERCASHGVTQVVILGAGLDTRSARLVPASARAFEVDRAGTQAAKLEGVRALDGYPVDAATYVTCDFESQHPLEPLVAAGFDLGAPAVFILEGVTPYLTEAAVQATLEPLARDVHPASVLAFDHVSEAFATGRSRYDDQRELHALVGDVGEPMRWGLRDPSSFLHRLGFAHVSTHPFDAILAELTAIPHDRKRGFHHQWITRCSAGASLGS